MFVAVIGGVLLICLALLDTFETVILPRRVTRKLRISHAFYGLTWLPWRAVGRLVKTTSRRENFLGWYGPLSLLLLLVIWATCIIVGCSLVTWGMGEAVIAPGQDHSYPTYLYMSGVAFFTLGLGDVIPLSGLGRFITVAEAGIGFGLLGAVIGYVPVLYQSFSRRELAIAKLDARAGSPPVAAEFLRRHSVRGAAAIEQFLLAWEDWAADILESHLSYPVLAYFRSQHENESWVASLAMILDLSAITTALLDCEATPVARLTFAMARHAAVDLSQVVNIVPVAPVPDRLPPADLARLKTLLAEAGQPVRAMPEADAKLAQLRDLYEPYINALALLLDMRLPGWLPDPTSHDNWEITAQPEYNVNTLL